MKVLWFSPVPINNNLTSGGWVLSLANNLIKMDNIELHIAFRSNKEKIENIYVRNTNTWHIPSEKFSKFERFKQNILGKEIDQNISYRYLEVVERVDPDIIQIFGTESDYGNIIFNTKIPIIIHIQCVYSVYYHKFLSGINEKDLRKYSSLKQKILRNTYLHHYKRRKKVVVREQKFYSKCKYFMGRTNWDRRCSSILAPNAKYYHCEETIREEFFNSVWSKEYDSENISILTIIGGALYKGLETMIESAVLLNQQNKKNIIWRIIGLSENDEIVKICKRKYGHKALKNIKFIGRIDSSDKIIEFMQRSDIYIHSSHIENSPNSICEAMLLGMPVIATYAGGTASLIKDSYNGILIQDGDPWSLAGSILEISNNFEEAKAMGSAARQTAVQRHDPKSITNNLMKIYTEILNKEEV